MLKKKKKASRMARKINGDGVSKESVGGGGVKRRRK
jgi:hypothetical protein